MSPRKSHDILDDLESCYWVLLFSALRRFRSNALPKDFKMLDQYDDSNDLSEDMTGGPQKMGFLFWPRRLRFESGPLDDLLGRLRQTSRLYCSFGADGGSRCPAPQDACTHILQLFDEALSRSDWPSSDAVPDRYPGYLKWTQSFGRGVTAVRNHPFILPLATCTLERQRRHPILGSERALQMKKIRVMKRPLASPVCPLLEVALLTFFCFQVFWFAQNGRNLVGT